MVHNCNGLCRKILLLSLSSSVSSSLVWGGATNSSPSKYITENFFADSQKVFEDASSEERAKLESRLNSVVNYGVGMAKDAYQQLTGKKYDSFRKFFSSEALKRYGYDKDSVLDELLASLKLVTRDMTDELGERLVLKLKAGNPQVNSAPVLEFVYYYALRASVGSGTGSDDQDENSKIMTYITRIEVPLKEKSSIATVAEIMETFDSDNAHLEKIKIASWEKVEGVPPELKKLLQAEQNADPAE